MRLRGEERGSGHRTLHAAGREGGKARAKPREGRGREGKTWAPRRRNQQPKQSDGLTLCVCVCMLCVCVCVCVCAMCHCDYINIASLHTHTRSCLHKRVQTYIPVHLPTADARICIRVRVRVYTQTLSQTQKIKKTSGFNK